jgi:tetratricopeptide (TPR) repeat protein
VRFAAVLIIAAFLPISALSATPQSADKLLAALAHAKDAESAQKIEDQLNLLWSHSGSDSADLLLQRAKNALNGQDVPTAREILKPLTAIAPNFAEAWRLRAEADLSAGDYADALLALQRTLALEPRQFDALASLGDVLEEFNDKPHALEAYRRSLAIDPYVEGVSDRVRELTHEVEGQKI